MPLSSNKRYVFCNLPEDKTNFWDFNKELEYLSPYAEFKSKEGKRRSGRIMTAIYMVYDPKSKVQISGNRDIEKAKKDIASNFLKDPYFKWNEYNKIIKAYIKDCRTSLEQEFYDYEMELKERRDYIKQLPWDVDAEKKDKMLTAQPKLMDQYLELHSRLEQERSSSKLYGGTKKSLLERMGGK